MYSLIIVYSAFTNMKILNQAECYTLRCRHLCCPLVAAALLIACSTVSAARIGRPDADCGGGAALAVGGLRPDGGPAPGPGPGLLLHWQGETTTIFIIFIIIQEGGC